PCAHTRARPAAARPLAPDGHGGGRARATLRGVARAGSQGTIGRVIAAEALMSAGRRPLGVGMGGGGDVVGALATAEACRIYHGAAPVLGGVTWERRVIDPQPGPRAMDEIEGGERLSDCV